MFYTKINDNCVLMGNMGQILAQWQHPVVSMVALDLLYWLMRLALHRRNVMAIKMCQAWSDRKGIPSN